MTEYSVEGTDEITGTGGGVTGTVGDEITGAIGETVGEIAGDGIAGTVGT